MDNIEELNDVIIDLGDAISATEGDSVFPGEEQNTLRIG